MAFTDAFEESGAGDTAFHGGFGLINYQGIVKPTFHAYRMLAALGDELVARADGVAVTRGEGRLVALAYHYPCEVTRSVPASFDERGVGRAADDVVDDVDVALELRAHASAAEDDAVA